MDLSDFANFSRDELIAKARVLGVDRAELMTRVELADEIVRRTEHDPIEQKRARGWLGVARDLVASVVESGLSLPDAAAMIRGDRPHLDPRSSEPVATVTLAEIYATQGHTERALGMLEEVLVLEPEHSAARALRERLLSQPDSRLVARSGDPIVPPPETGPAELAPNLVEAGAKPSPELDSGEAVSEPPDASPPTLIILRVDGSDPLLCWELEKPPQNELPLQVVCLAFAGASGSVERSELTVPVTEGRGSAVLESLPPNAVLRAALGVEVDAEFLPWAIASEVEARDGEVKVTYRPPGVATRIPTQVERSLARRHAP